MLRELLRRVDMMVIYENHLDALVRLHTPLPPAKIGGAVRCRAAAATNPPSGPNAGETEVLIPAGYVRVALRPDVRAQRRRQALRSRSTATRRPKLPAPGLPFSLVFRAEIGKEDVILKVASAYQHASKRRVTPPAFPVAETADDDDRVAVNAHGQSATRRSDVRQDNQLSGGVASVLTVGVADRAPCCQRRRRPSASISRKRRSATSIAPSRRGRSPAAVWCRPTSTGPARTTARATSS